MTNHHYDNSERLEGVSEQDWREALDEVNKKMPKPMTQEEYKQMMRHYFPMLKRWISAQ